MVRIAVLSVLLVIAGLAASADMATRDAFILSCQLFPADATAADFAARFGAANVVEGQVYLGEGEYEAGTILFADVPEQRAEITWQQPAVKRAPKMMRIRGAKSRWRTPQGLTLGLALPTVERLNRRPFRLWGFDWDYGGTTLSWSGGMLSRAESPTCKVWARFSRDEQPRSSEASHLAAQVSGEREFSSGHPGMQAAHAHVGAAGLFWQQ
jgi:hypothetical protein